MASSRRAPWILYLVVFFAVRAECSKAEEASTSIASVVSKAFESYPRLTGDGKLTSEDLRNFLEHLRRQEQGAPKSTRHAEEQHLNNIFHALYDHIPAKQDISREELQKALGKVSDVADEHLMHKEPTGQAACEGLPEHILERKGSCELKRFRHKLESSRTTSALFDTARWVRNFERGLQMMWEIYEAKLNPMHIFVNSGPPSPPTQYNKATAGSGIRSSSSSSSRSSKKKAKSKHKDEL